MTDATQGRAAPKKEPSIKWKIFVFLLGFCLLLLGLLWVFQTVFLESFYSFIRMHEAERQADVFAGDVENGASAFVEGVIGIGSDTYIELLPLDGEGALSAEAFQVQLTLYPVESWQPLLEEVRAADGRLTVRLHSEPPRDAGGPKKHIFNANWLDPTPLHFSEESILCARLVRGDDGGEYLLLLRAALMPLDATQSTLRIQLLFISALTLILAVGFAFIIAKRVAKPIEQLNDTAAELGRGNYDITFCGEGYREVAELSGTLNHTATELAKTDALRRDLIANVSHDLRTPLTLITGYAEMMRDIPGENTPENLQVVVEESKRLSSLVGDLLDLSQLQAGTVGLKLSRFNLGDEVDAIIDRFAKLSGDAYTVRCENSAGDVMVEADRTRIAQVVYNFLINAMTHGGEDKTITLRQSAQDGRVCVEVIDKGEGIDPAQLPYIWDRYYKVDKVHKRAAAGAGLGLSIVKSILEQHPGIEYGVHSLPGQGSTFWFSLPVCHSGAPE